MSAELENNFKNIQIELNKGSIRVFDVMLDTDDIIDMSSFIKAQEILTKYDIDFS